jgi:hypothetical protein
MAVLKYSYKRNTNYSDVHLFFDVMDIKGNYAMEITSVSYNSDPVIYIEYDISNLEKNSSYTIRCNSVSYCSIKEIGKYETDGLSFMYNGLEFKLLSETIDGEKSLVLKCEKEIEVDEFPRLITKGVVEWERLFSNHYELKTVVLTKEEVKTVLGETKDEYNDQDIETLMSYLKEKHNLTFEKHMIEFQLDDTYNTTDYRINFKDDVFTSNIIYEDFRPSSISKIIGYDTEFQHEDINVELVLTSEDK